MTPERLRQELRATFWQGFVIGGLLATFWFTVYVVFRAATL